MGNRDASRNVTRLDVVLASITVLVFLVPLFLLTMFPDAKSIRFVLGDGRVFVWWALFYAALFANRRRIDRFVARWERRRHV